MDETYTDTIIRQCPITPKIHEVIPAAGLTPPSPHPEFSLAFAKRVARQYLTGELSFGKADTAMNWLYAFSDVTETAPGEMPDLALQIFYAFDAGEFHDADDPRDVDPELEYTRPRIKDPVESSFN